MWPIMGSIAERRLTSPKAKRAGGRGASTLCLSLTVTSLTVTRTKSHSCRGSGDLLTTASGQGEKTTASHDQARQTRAREGTRDD
jgi:hypothetical protein